MQFTYIVYAIQLAIPIFMWRKQAAIKIDTLVEIFAKDHIEKYILTLVYFQWMKEIKYIFNIKLIITLKFYRKNSNKYHSIDQHWLIRWTFEIKIDTKKNW